MSYRLSHIPNASVIELPEALEGYRRDESHIVGKLPLAVVKPHGPNALKELVRLAKGDGLNLVPRGTGTGKAGGAIPVDKSIIVDLSEYPGEIRLSQADMALRAPSSALLRDVKAVAVNHRLYYPPDPNSWDQCSFGGTMATNAGGLAACKYGMTRHWVLSIDALMDDGEIHRIGVDTAKNNAGPNIAQLMVGSEGIFGIITAASVRLISAPDRRLTMLLPVPDWNALLGLPERLVSNCLLPCAFEFWDPVVLQHLRQFGPEEARRLPGEALAILEFDNPDCEEHEFTGNVIETLGSLSEYLRIATDSRQREAIWNVRRLTSVVLKEQYPHKISEDIAVPRSKVRAFFEGAKKSQLPLATYGHLGDGNLHVNILVPGSDQSERDIYGLFRLVLELGGTLTGEHGIGLAKRDAFLALTDPWQIQAIRAIKKALDPCNIFNCGKVV